MCKGVVRPFLIFFCNTNGAAVAGFCGLKEIKTAAKLLSEFRSWFCDAQSWQVGGKGGGRGKTGRAASPSSLPPYFPAGKLKQLYRDGGLGL